MKIRALALLFLTSLLALAPSVSQAEGDPEFRLGFKVLADQIPSIAGRPIENEHYGANGDSLQQTTTGLMVWRKADNWTAFTNGSITWINGPFGVQSRPNEQRFDWEAAEPGRQPSVQPTQVPTQQPAQQPTLQSNPLPTSFSPSRPVSPVASAGSAARYGVAEAFRHDESTQLGITWQRNIFSWSDLQPGGPDDWRADLYFLPEILQRETDRGIEIVGVLQFTPAWAAQNPSDGQRSVPKNLSAPAESRDNYWAQFAARIASHYKGRIDKWIFWNEPEFRPGDQGAGQSFTWFGSDADYYLLLKRGYQAVKAANPNATVVFGATSYWVDINAGRQSFFKRLLDIAAADPEARANNFFFDAVAFNLYWAPDDLLRVYMEMRDAMKAKGIDKPIWITELNAMPYDDPATPKAADGARVTQLVQADFVLQALAMASAAGYQRIGWYRITDGNIWREQEVWGLLRDDGSARPAFNAMKTAVSQFSGARKVTFVPLEHPDQPFGTPWPQDPNSYYPNWQVYQVVFDHSDGRRVTVLWNGSGNPLRVRVPKLGSGAVLLDKFGQQSSLTEVGGWYVIDLAAATVHGPLDPQGYHYIGGPPVLVVERGVPSDASIQEPRLGDPGSVQPGLQISLDPSAQRFRPGETARFTLRLRGIEGFSSPVQLAVPALPGGARVEMPATAYPGERVPVTVYSDSTLEPNLYVLPLEATGGGLASSTDLVLEVPAP